MDEKFLALHGLAVCKAADADGVAAVTGQDPQAVTSLLDAAVDEGLLVSGGGRYMLTPAGRSGLDDGYPQACARQRDDVEFVAAYDKFEPINRKLLDLFTRWQTVSTGGETVPNDHSDADYDAKIIDQLGDLHERAERVLTAFGKSLPRMEIYRSRLAAAYDKVLAGEHDFVSGVRVDSYHTVWFQLHEDLLRILGRSREEV